MKEWFRQNFEALARGRRFVTHDIWRIGRPGEEVHHGFIIKQIRVAILVVQGMVQDTLLLRAAALTFATTLALVPFLILMLLTFQAFELDKILYEHIITELVTYAKETNGHPGNSPDPESIEDGGIAPPQDTAATEDDVGDEAEMPGQDSGEEPNETPKEEPTPPKHGESDGNTQLIEQVLDIFLQGGQGADPESTDSPIKQLVGFVEGKADAQTIGITGIIIVFTTVFGLMMNIESSFNSIWGIKKSRNWRRMVTDYLTVLVLLPFVVVVVLSVTAVLANDSLTEQLGTAMVFFLRSLRVALIWTVFSGFYILVPNTRVSVRYAIIGGVIAGTFWNVLSWAYVAFQIGITKYSLLYSGSAQIPLLLMWIYLSWVTLLFGAELTFAYQNETTFAMERLAEGATVAYREALGLRTIMEIAWRFDEGLAGLTIQEAAEGWHVPTRLLNETLSRLEDADIITSCGTEPVTYRPSRSIAKISVKDVVKTFRESGQDPSSLREDKVFLPWFKELSGENNQFMNKTLDELVRQLRSEKAVELEDVAVEDMV